jgi:hypothetical protein
MEREISNPSLTQRGEKRLMKGPVGSAVVCAKHAVAGILLLLESFKYGRHRRTHWHGAGLLILGIGRLHGDRLTPKINIGPCQGQQLRGAEPGV